MTPEEELALLDEADSQAVEPIQNTQTMEGPEDAESELALLEEADDAHIENLRKDVSSTEAAAGGMIQGLTLEFGDEIGGAFGAIKDTFIDPNSSITNIYQTYRKNRDSYRKAFNDAKLAYPAVYGLSQAAGSLAPVAALGALTGGAGVAAGGAIVGGISGLGATEELGDFEQVAEDMALNALMSAGAGAAGKAVASAGGATAKMLTSVKEKIIQTFDGPIFGKVKDMVGNAVLGTMGMNKTAVNVFSQIVKQNIPVVNTNLEKSLVKIATNFEANPARWNTPMVKLGIAAQISTSEMLKNMAGIESIIDLEASPLIRTTEDVMRKKDSILTALDQVDPNVAAQLESALANNDFNKVGGIMSITASLPAASRFVMPGVGWDGRVFSPEDAAVIEQQINGSRRPAWQKKQDLEDLRSSGRIPITDEQPYFQKESVRKTRNLSGKKLGDY